MAGQFQFNDDTEPFTLPLLTSDMLTPADDEVREEVGDLALCTPNIVSRRKRKNAHLTLEQKLTIIEAVESGRSRTIVCKEFGLPSSTLTELLKRKEEIRFALNSSVFTPQRKKMRTTKYAELEDELYRWYVQITQVQKGTVSGLELLNQASQLAIQMDLDFHPSSGWLGRFKARRGISTKMPSKGKRTGNDHNEEFDLLDASVTDGRRWYAPPKPPEVPTECATTAVKTWTSSILPEVLKRYHPRDIFTAGETGLYYNCTPEKMPPFIGEDCEDGRFSKHRLTLMAATNALGTEKLPLIAIGKYTQPRCFKNRKSIPTEYMANAKAWMIAPFFEQWTRKLDDAMVAEGRNIVLFVSPSKAHPRVPGLLAVSVIYLPPEKQLQPACQGMLHTLKLNYRRSLMQRRLHFADVNGPSEDCEINLVDALHWLRAAWKDVSPRCIYKSFQNAEFNLPPYETLVFRGEQPSSSSSYDPCQLECDTVLESNNLMVTDAEYNRLFEALARTLMLDPFITAESYATLDDDIATTGELTEKETKDALDRNRVDEDEEEKLPPPPPPPPPTIVEAKECLVKLARFFASERRTEQVFDKISKLRGQINEMSDSRHGPESTIIDLFSGKKKRGRKVTKKKKTCTIPSVGSGSE